MRGSTRGQRPPILVTGVPRSGTTWLARQLALTPHTALAGREPMNPRGRQYALGGSLTAWTILDAPSRRQRVALRSAYAGLNPFVYSRYGHRQWAAPGPGTRVVVKDPFALLSLAAVHDLTGARPVVLVRHPGAVLLSYRRMGWTADTDEVRSLAKAHLPQAPTPSGTLTDAAAFGWFWNTLHEMALPGIEGSGAVVVFHEDLAAGADASMSILAATLGLDGRAQADQPPAHQPTTSSAVDPDRLHNFDRDPRTVAAAWRDEISDTELEALEEATATAMSSLASRRLDLTDRTGSSTDHRESHDSPGATARDS